MREPARAECSGSCPAARRDLRGVGGAPHRRHRHLLGGEQQQEEQEEQEKGHARLPPGGARTADYGHSSGAGRKTKSSEAQNKRPRHSDGGDKGHEEVHVQHGGGVRPERHVTLTFLHVSLIFMYLSPGRPQGVLKGIFEQHDFGGDHGLVVALEFAQGGGGRLG